MLKSSWRLLNREQPRFLNLILQTLMSQRVFYFAHIYKSESDYRSVVYSFEAIIV